MSNTILLDEIGERISGREDKMKGFKLLYAATDKADVDEFHRKCDNKGPTVTILYGMHNSWFGGYTSKDWSSPIKKRKVKDENAFLFTKNDNENAKCIFLPIKKDKTDLAITCDQKYGPTFGAKSSGAYDLQTFKRDKRPESTYADGSLNLNGSINIKTAYATGADQPKIKPEDINSGRMVVKRLEVYQVKNDECEEMLFEKLETDLLARAKDETIVKGRLKKDFEKTKQKLIEMEPLPGFNIDRYNILLLGAIGAGKSSFINTLSTVFTRNVVPIAAARQATTSVTSKVTVYNIKTQNEEKSKIFIYDFRGFEDMRGYGDELERLLEGKLPDEYKFPDKVEEVKEKEEANPTLNDKIHCVCMVEGNSDFENYSAELLERNKDVQRRISKKGLPLVVVATKFDLLCLNIEKNVDHLLKCPKAREAIARIAGFYGEQGKHVFPVVNYLSEKEPLDTKDQLALVAIRDICNLIEGNLMHHKEKKEIPDDWKKREDLLPAMKNDDERRMFLRSVTDKMLAFGDKVLRVLVIGPTRSGKSTFIDSIASSLCNSIVFGTENTGGACANVESATSTTEKYCMKYAVDGTETRRSSVYLGDTPGFQEEAGITEDHVKFIINGNVPDKYKIISGIQETQEDFKREPTPGDKMHCVCLVFDCVNIQKGLSETMKKSMKNLLRVVTTQACPLMVVLTKCDKASKEIKAGAYRVFEDAKVRDCKDKLMETFGLKQQQIFPVVNYVHDNVVDLQKDALLLAAYSNILKIGKKRLQEIEEEA